MGVVVRRYIDILTIIINFPYSTCISSFLAAASLLLCSFLKWFLVFSIYINVDYLIMRHCWFKISSSFPSAYWCVPIVYSRSLLQLQVVSIALATRNDYEYKSC